MTRPVRVFLVEDNPGDVELMRTALDRGKVVVELVVREDGPSAISYLDDPDHPLPDVVLLDLNLPGVSGLDILDHMQQCETLKMVPTVMVTTSEAETDVIRSYAIGANAFVTKPIDVGEFIEAMRVLGDFWFVIAKRPPYQGAPQ